MGMFDEIEIKCECPYCGEVSMKIAQTKDFLCFLDTYQVGDSIPDSCVKSDDFVIDSIIECKSDTCMFWAAVRDLKIQKNISGFGMLWTAKIRIKDGKITNELTIAELNDSKVLGDLSEKLLYPEIWDLIRNKYDKLSKYDLIRKYSSLIRDVDTIRSEYNRIVKENNGDVLQFYKYLKERNIDLSADSLILSALAIVDEKLTSSCLTICSLGDEI